MIRQGDAVTIRAEYRAEGEGLRLYLAASDEADGFVTITPVDWPYRFKPVERVRVTMLEPGPVS
jgi:hypothetical protein